MNKKEHLEKTITKYVIATLDQPTLYMNKIYQQKKYLFTTDIDMSTKFVSKSVAKIMIDYYRQDTHTADKCDLVILPLKVNYYLIEDGDPDE